MVQVCGIFLKFLKISLEIFDYFLINYYNEKYQSLTLAAMPFFPCKDFKNLLCFSNICAHSAWFKQRGTAEES